MGIGTSSPNENLSIRNNTGPASLSLSGLAATEGAVFTFENTAATQFTANRNNHYINFITSSGGSVSAGGYARIQVGHETAGQNGTFISLSTAPNAGALAERMRITSTGNVGIGTSAPAAKLHLDGFSGAVDGTKGIRLTNNASTIAMFEIGGFNDSYVGTLSASNFSIRTNNTARMTVVGSTGSVGIGTSSPQSDLEIQSKTTGTDAVISLTAAGTRRYQIKALTSVGALAFVDESLASERLRIDSSGNVGIGTSSVTAIYGSTVQIGSGSTTSTVSLVGTGAGTTGDVFLASTGSEASLTARASTPLILGTNDVERLRIDSSGNVLCGSDGGGDIGSDTKRFKDLYLSGGVYLGGTGAANLLDDYEEGTFAADLQFGGATTGISYASRTARYVKIGTLVYINIAVSINSKGTATGAATIAGLPFTQSSVGTNYPNLSLRSVNGITFTNCLYATANDGATTITLMDDNGFGTQALLTNADFLNATEFNITGVYEAA